ncbi:MAG: hypothetical protein LQ340_003956 [Diploschistes diacapsis]|nr:MAG: hypothetical protein LQ340_003956 [Diploschistes diacapsis]
MAAKLPQNALLYLAHHIFLPPLLPQKDDYKDECESALLLAVENSAEKFRSYAGEDTDRFVKRVEMIVNNFRTLQDGTGGISENRLRKAFETVMSHGLYFHAVRMFELLNGPSDTFLTLYLRAQNAGILVSKSQDAMLFQAFELSPNNASAMCTKGRLLRMFPASAIAVDSDSCREDGFFSALSLAIAKLSNRAAPGMQPVVHKAGQMHQEIRDTSSPAMVTEYLMSFLRAAGKPKEVPVIWKHTREEVLWLDCLKPWHRSPMWLLVRVSLQLQCSGLVSPTEHDHRLYKIFMIFLMANILQLCQKSAFPCDLLHAMSAKILRRLAKLDPDLRKAWAPFVKNVVTDTHSTISKQWQQIVEMDAARLDFSSLRLLKIHEDLGHNLTELDRYISGISERHKSSASKIFEPKTPLPRHSSKDLPEFSGNCSEDYLVYELAAFENWVELNLNIWVERHIDDPRTSGLLKRAMQSYYNCAVQCYAGLPEAYSIMILTLMELWVACDRSACSIHQLLLAYSPEISVPLLQSLLLPMWNQMQRLATIERYIGKRQRRAADDSVFRSIKSQNAFPVKYFDQSPVHQTLFSNIQQLARSKRDAKCRELASKKEQHSNLVRRHDRMACE